jgi:hypothetical protein
LSINYPLPSKHHVATLRTNATQAFPPDLLDGLEGLLGMIMAECMRSAPMRRQPIFGLAAAITGVGALAGRRYKSPTDVRTNLYTLILGRTSSGKSQPQKVLKRLFNEAGLSRYLSGDYQSGSALMGEFQEHPVRLSIIDECGIWLTGLTAIRTPKYLLDIKKHLTTLYSEADGIVVGNSYADRKLRPTINLHQPHLCIFGAGTPEHFFESLQSGALKDGFLPRFMVFKPDDDLPPRIIDPVPLEISPEMIRAAQKISGTCQEDGNLAGIVQMQHDQSYPVSVVPYTACGKAEHEMHMCRLDADQQSGSCDTALENLMGKLPEHTIKLAMIRAISRDPVAPVMDKVCVGWAWRLSEHCVSTMFAMSRRYMSDNEMEADHKFVREIIKNAGEYGIMKRDLLRKTERLGTKKLGAVLDAIIEAGWVSAEKLLSGPRGGRPGFRFTIAA